MKLVGSLFLDIKTRAKECFESNMRSKSFKFKQFEIFHDKCAMKVGTDGVLLGAWVSVSDCNKILDVGTGTGLIAMMIAQRNRTAKICAIEIDNDASLQAIENVSRSDFASQISILNVPFNDFVNQTDQIFDHIVCNPPYFSKSLHSPNYARTRARHNIDLSVIELIENSKTIMHPSSKLSVVFPFQEWDLVEKSIKENNWKISRRLDVFSTTKSQQPKRILLELTAINNLIVPVFESLCIEKERHVYTEEYIGLTKDFYLKM